MPVFCVECERPFEDEDEDEIVAHEGMCVDCWEGQFTYCTGDEDY